jgi:probable rRNA maturation factor
MPTQITVIRRPAVRALRGVPASPTIRRRMNAMLTALQLHEAEVSILLTDDKEIKILNRTYRGIDRPTDVLSFSMKEGEAGDVAGEILGDLVISVVRARAQARLGKRPLLDEMTLLFAHGLLHLLGWDHRTKAEDRRMRGKCDELCVIAGGAPLFSLGGVDDEGRPRPLPRKEPAAPKARQKQGSQTRGRV